MDYSIRTENLSRQFGKLRAVDGISLQVPRGSIFGLLGPNGAGKTTTIHLLLGLIEPTEGRAEVLGFDTREFPGEIRARTGALLEHAGIYERLSAEENLEFFARCWRMPSAVRRQRIKESLERVGLWERRKESVGTWSRGMKQRLAISRTLIHKPTLIFLDEPTAGFDPAAAAAFRSELKNLVDAEGLTVFLTTHNLAEAEQLCSNVGVIRNGNLLDVGPPKQIGLRDPVRNVMISGTGFTDELLELVRKHPGIVHADSKDGTMMLRISSGVPTAPLVRLLIESGAELEEVRGEQSSLEKNFLALMEQGK